MQLTERIKNELIRKDGKINTAVIRQQRFIESQLYQDIILSTQFLPHTAPMKERIYCILHNIYDHPICEVCGEQAVFLPAFNEGYSKTCNKQSCKSRHSSTKRIQTCIQKYGSKISEKSRTLIKDRVHENLLTKGRETIKEKYGVYNPSHIDGHREKVQNTLRERYGVTEIHNIPHHRQAIIDRRLNKFKMLCSNVNLLDVNKRTNDSRQLFDIHYKCPICNNDELIHSETFKWRAENYETVCSRCLNITTSSLVEQTLLTFIKNIYNGEVITNSRDIIPPYEIDIYIPEYKLAIEFDGLFWHSENGPGSRITKNYHLMKTQMCEEQGIRLIHIFEHEWAHKQQIVESRLRGALGLNKTLYARKCQITQLSPEQACEFFEQTHIQGDRPTSIIFGLISNGEIVAAMSFIKPRYSKDFEWELLRYSSAINTNVVGGGSRLLSAFIRQYKPQSIISYSDRRWSNLTPFYSSIGFTFSHYSTPNYYYFRSQDGMRLLSRVSFQKHKLHNKLKIFDSNLTESENMFLNGYRRIWDCGNSVWHLYM